MRFSFLTGDMNYTTYGGKWISTRQNNGEFDYYFVIELLNWPETVGQREAPRKRTTFRCRSFRPSKPKRKSPTRWIVAALRRKCLRQQPTTASAIRRLWKRCTVTGSIPRSGVKTGTIGAP